MKKTIAVVLAMMLVMSMGLTVFASVDVDRFDGMDVYNLTEDGEAQIGFWLANVYQAGDWVALSEGNYVAATFTAEKAFSSIAIPFWSGDPNTFAGITPTDVEFALFKAVEGNLGEDYKSENAVVLLNKTCDHDEVDFIWTFDQQPAGRYCIRITQLTEEGGYIVIAQGDPADDDAEFDIDNVMKNTTMQEGLALTIIYGDPVTPVDPTEAPATPTPVPADQLYYLYDKDVTVNTGWWLHPVAEGSSIDVNFETTSGFSGFNFFAYCCEIYVPMDLVLLDEDENEVWTGSASCKSNAPYTVDMGKTFGPGIYTLSFVGGDVSEIEEDTWFVLGSSQLNEELGDEYVTVVGGLTNDSTGPAPYISLIKGEVDPNATEQPTAEPTAAPTEAPTAAPTAAPTEAPKATDEPAATEAPKPTEDAGNKSNEEKKGPNVGLIIGIVAAVAVVAAVVIVIATKAKGKKK